MAESRANALAVMSQDDFDSFVLLQQDPKETREMIAEALGPDGLTRFNLTNIRVGSGGAIVWTVPTLNDEPDYPKFVDVIILERQTARGWWARSLDDSGGGSPPDCSSTDGVTGIGWYGKGSESNPSGACYGCPMNAFNTAKKGSGKDCREFTLLFVVRDPNKFLPDVVVLPPSSVGVMKNYFVGVISSGLRFYGAIYRLNLEKVSNGQGIAYARVKPALLGRLSPEQTKTVEAMRKQLANVLGSVTIDLTPANVPDDVRHASESSDDGDDCIPPEFAGRPTEPDGPSDDGEAGAKAEAFVAAAAQAAGMAGSEEPAEAPPIAAGGKRRAAAANILNDDGTPPPVA